MKKLLCVLLALAMVSTMFIATATQVSAGGSNVGKVEEGYTPAEGSIAVSTPEEFAAMEAGKNYHLTADIKIDKTWNAGADVTGNKDNTPFSGIFDGNGHTVTVSAPMFAEATNATIKNLIIKGAIVDFALYGAVVAMRTNGTLIVENIYNYASVSSATYATSILADGGPSANVTIRNCVNEGNMTSGKNTVAGFVGYILDGTLTVENCVNTGKLEATNSYGGGIVGRFGENGSTVDDTCTIKNCQNYGTVTASKSQVGGILGYGIGLITVEDCLSDATITNKSGTAGGLIGVVGQKDGKKLALSLTGSVNYGDVYGTTLAAGIVGRSGREGEASGYAYIIENCENHGNVYAAFPKGSTSDSYYAGGIAAYAYGGSANATINCINTGNVFVTTPTDGTLAKSYVGGLIGYVASTKYEIKNNINLGSISITGTLGSTNAVALIAFDNKPTADLINLPANNYSVASGDIPTFMFSDGNASDAAMAKIITTAQAESGELAFMANEGAGKTVFYQNLKEDAFPTLFAAEDGSNKVFSNGNGGYANPTANFTALSALIETADTYTAEKYVSGWEEFAAALAAAKVVASNPVALQETVDASAKTLEDAMNALVTKKYAKIGDVEYESLELAIEAAKAGDTIILLDNIVATATITVNKSVTLDGAGKTVTAGEFVAINVTGSSLDVTIKNLTVNSGNKGIVLLSSNSLEEKSKLTIADVKVTSTKEAVEVQKFWDVDMDRCNLEGDHGFRVTKSNSFNTITIDDSVLLGNTGYGAYFRQSSTVTLTNTTVTTKATVPSSDTDKDNQPNSAIQIITADTADEGTTLTLNNCNVTSAGGYCVYVNPNNTLYINGDEGSYQMDAPADVKIRDSIINVGSNNATATITGGTFTHSKTGVVRAYGENSVLTITGGTFVYDNANGAGNVVRAGTETAFGTINIEGGRFMTNGSGPIINYVHANGVVNFSGGNYENVGEHDVKIVAQEFGNIVDTSRDRLFPMNSSTAVFENGVFVDPDAAPEGPLVGDTIDMVLVLTVLSAIAVGFTVTALSRKKRHEND